MNLSKIPAKQITAENFTFQLDINGETFDRFLGTVISNENSEVRARVKIMKSGDVRESFSRNMIYCDPKLSSGRAKAIIALQQATK